MSGREAAKTAADRSSGPGKSVAEFDAELAQLSIEGFWSTYGEMPAEPTPRAAGFAWRWREVRPKLLQASEVIDLEEGAERRVLRLCTPGMPWKSTTETIQASFQLVMPGEVARAHRHSAAALRFVIEGTGGNTVVNGERYPMAPGDLILTPQTCWHDHGNSSDEPVIWMDVLDFPFVRALNSLFFEPYKDRTQASLTVPKGGFRFHYDGPETIATLRGMADADADPFDGVTLDYVNPLDGGPTLPTLQCRLHRLLAGHRTRRHRHTWNSIFHVVEGEGETTVGDSTFKWAAHDVISVPAWQWHQHRCAKGSEAIVFSVSDDPVFRAFGLDRVEAV